MNQEPKYIRLSIALDREDWNKLQAVAEAQAKRFHTPISASAMARTAIAFYLDRLPQEAIELDSNIA